MDMLRPSRIAMVVAATAGVPYLASNVQHSPTEQATAGHTDALGHAVQAETTPMQALDGPRSIPIGQVLRFDVTTTWVLSTWPRVTTGLADLELQGYRVALVTGVRPTDLAGSLTYYFNKEQRVARILMSANTGDPSELVQLLVQHYGFQRVVVADAGLHLYQAKESGRVVGELRIKPANIVRQDSPLNRFSVSLVMDRPARSN